MEGINKVFLIISVISIVGAYIFLITNLRYSRALKKIANTANDGMYSSDKHIECISIASKTLKSEK